ERRRGDEALRLVHRALRHPRSEGRQGYPGAPVGRSRPLSAEPESVDRLTPVKDDGGAVHERGRIRHQEGCDVGDLVALRQPAEEDQILDRLAIDEAAIEVTLDAWREGGTRAQRVDAQTLGAIIHGHL